MTTALIIGAGIAGLTTAMGLQRVGIEPVLYEARPTGADETGYFLTLAVNGLDALRTLDAHRAVLAEAFPSRTIRFQSGTGRSLGTLPIGGTLPDGTVTHTIKRGALHRALVAEARRRGIRIEHGKRLLDVAQNGTPVAGVTARFDDGTEAKGDLLIGADGIWSRVRTLIDPDAPVPRYTGLGNVGGFTRSTEVFAAPGEYIMIFGKRGFFGYTVSPDGEIWWFANPPSPRPLTREELAATTSDQWRQRLVELFSVDATAAADVIWSTDGPLRVLNQYDLPTVPVWSRGRMVIVGDAAHAASPSSGQGASMAVEDAVTLATCLRAHGDAPAAFAAYERARRARVERVAAQAAKTSTAKAAGPVARMVRDLVLPFVFQRAARSTRHDWLYGHHIPWERSAGTASAGVARHQSEEGAA